MKYDVVIGLELHAELNTKSKVFSSAINSYNEIPNSNIYPLDMGFPGTLPSLNKEAVKKALKMALCLNCEIPKYLIFDRKNYYYPDLPKGYQITQSHFPIGVNGYIELNSGKILIHDIHLEEDSASLDHYDSTSLIDYNRSGVPLIEIVTEPCITSPDMAIDYLENIRNILKYANISDADTKKGQIRCDVNVSLKETGSPILGTKVEVKNINSFNGVYETINAEIYRQTKLLDEGRKNEIVQETRRYDAETNTTIRMREKVEAIDYKYFIEPNIPKFKLTDDFINSVKKEIPELPNIRKKKYINDYNLSDDDANIIIKNKNISDYFEECIKIDINPKTAFNWITTQIMGYLNNNEKDIKELYLTPQILKTIINNIENGNISSKQAKEIFIKVINEKIDPNTLIKDNSQVSNKEELYNIIKNIVDNNLSLKDEYKNGKSNIFDYLVGQVMKETRGKANPILTKEILSDLLNN